MSTQTKNQNNNNLPEKKKNGKENSLFMYQIVTFFVLFISYACYNYNRKSASFVAPNLLAIGLLTKSQSGVIISCQNTAYAISKFVGGVLSDKLSAKILLSTGLGLSGISALLYGTTETPSVWAALWFLNGLAQGAGWPACSKIIKKWYGPTYFGTLWSVLTGSSNAAGTLSPLISTYILINYGWTATLTAAGSISVAMAGICFLALVDDPVSIGLPDPNQKVASKEEKKTTKVTSNSSSSMTVSDLIRSPFLWVISLSYLIVFSFKTVLTDWGTVFLMEELGRTQFQASSFTSAFETGGFLGNILAGVLTDKFGSKIKTEGNPRMIVSTGFLGLSVLGLHFFIHGVSVDTPQILCSLTGAVLGASVFGPISIFGMSASESYPSHLSGTAHAVVALAANVGAIFAGYPVSRLIQIYGWSVVFSMFEGGLFFITALILLSKKYHGNKVKHD